MGIPVDEIVSMHYPSTTVDNLQKLHLHIHSRKQLVYTSLVELQEPVARVGTT